MPGGGDGVRLRWYREVILAACFYAVYSLVRNQFGSAAVPPSRALENALHVIRIERAVHLFVEAQIQHAFLGWTILLRICNIFYGTFHFVVTAGVLVVLYRWAPARYRKWRTVLGFTTALALIGFSLFPLMPPRLLDDFGPYGGRSLQFHFVDTLAKVGGLWSFESHGMQPISNQYAAMPSLHVAWSTWCALAVLPLVRRRRLRPLLFLYPCVTLFAVIVTGNHYWLDGAGGLVVLTAGYGLTLWLGSLRGWNRVTVTDP
jgi:amino acid transporter